MPELVVGAAALEREEKTRLLLQLAVRAAGEPTVLDGVLARLLLVTRPSDAVSLDRLERVRASHAARPTPDVAPFEPLR